MTDTERNTAFAEAGRELSRPACIADTDGIVPEAELSDDEKIDIAARRILERYKPAFLELAK